MPVNFKTLFISLPGFIVLSVFFSGCYYDVEQELYPKPIDSGMNCDTSNASFSTKIYPLIQSKCNNCHSTSISSGGISLEGYANVLVSEQNGKLMGTINHNAGFSPMPQGGAKLTDCEIALLTTWINAGALNN